MRATEEQHNARKCEMMEKCFECYAENGLTGTGIKALAAACGCTTGNLYSYFNSVDELILESTAYCMAKVEDDFMKKAPTDPKDAMRFIEEIPYWTAKKHGKKYRLMYQVYTLPKYMEYGKRFFEGVNERYTAKRRTKGGNESKLPRNRGKIFFAFAKGGSCNSSAFFYCAQYCVLQRR